MKTLTQYIKESLINEGGNAVKGTPMTQPQLKEVYADVIKNLLPGLGLGEAGVDFDAIGSYGKKDPEQTSGDLDIAVSIEKISNFFGTPVQDVEKTIMNYLDERDLYYKHNKGVRVISVSWPIPGTNDYGQVDLMPSFDMGFSRWMYHSPDFRKGESKYKGLFRNQFLMKILNNINQKVLSRNENDEILEFEKYALRMYNGISRIIKTYIGKNGQRNTTCVTKEDFDKFVTRVPEEIVKIAFGENTSVKDTMTFESMYKLFMSDSFVHKDNREEILTEFIEEMLNNNFIIPTEIHDDWQDLIDKIIEARQEKQRLAAEKKAAREAKKLEEERLKAERAAARQAKKLEKERIAAERAAARQTKKK